MVGKAALLKENKFVTCASTCKASAPQYCFFLVRILISSIIEDN